MRPVEFRTRTMLLERTALDAGTPPVVTTDWRQAVPALFGVRLTLRELRRSDAPMLFAMLRTEEVERFITPAPTTVQGFERFIAWSIHEREAGRYVCFGIVPDGLDHAVGIIQVRALDPMFGTAEWGFAIGVPFWGTGVFAEGARLVVDFVFAVAGAHRLEARSAVTNGRGNGALAKLGAVREGLLRKSFWQDGKYVDQALWSIVREDWLQSKAVWTDNVH